MKIKKFRKWLCGFLAAIMFITNMPFGLLSNEKTHNVVAEEIKDDDSGVDKDLEGPVVTEARLVENGDELRYWDTFSVIFSGQDEEGMIADVGYCHLVGGSSDIGLSSESVEYNEVDNVYKMTFRVNMDPGLYELDYIRVLDDSDNYCIYQMSELGQGFQVVKDEIEQHKFTVTDISVSTSEIVITEEDDEQYIDIRIDADYNLPFDKEWTYQLSIGLEVDKNEENYRKSSYEEIGGILLYDHEEGQFIGKLLVYNNHSAGAYSLGSCQIDIYKEEQCILFPELVFEDECCITVNRQFPSEYSCEIEDVYFLLNGEKVQSGFKANEDDEIKVIVNVTNESELIKDAYLVIEGMTYQLTKKSQGMYEAILLSDDLSAKELKITAVDFIDIYENYQKNQEMLDYSDLWFCLYKDGICNDKFRNVYIEFSYVENIIDGDINETSYTEYATLGKCIRLGELFPDGFPIATEIEGLNFVGWSLGGEIVDENTIIDIDDYFVEGAFMPYTYELKLEAVYDKKLVEILLIYCSELNVDQEKYVTLFMDKDVTDKEIIEILNNENLFEVSHCEELEFVEWIAVDGTDSNEVSSDNLSEIVLVAKYNKIPVTVYISYLNQDNEYDSRSQTLYLNEGITYGELIQMIEQLSIVHSDKAGYVGYEIGWTYVAGQYQNDSVLDLDSQLTGIQEIYIDSIYQKKCVSIKSDYYGEDNVFNYESTPYFIEEKITYAELLILEDINVEHTEAAQFIEWEWTLPSEIILDQYIIEDRYIERTAKYDKEKIWPCFEYKNNGGGTTCTSQKVVFVKENATYDDVLAETWQVNVEHNELLTFLRWDVYRDGVLLEGDMLKELYSDEAFVSFKAVYKNNREDGFEYKMLEDGTISITGYYGTESEVNIPYIIGNAPVVGIENYAFENCTGVKVVNLSQNIVQIGKQAFTNCNSLEAINVEEANIGYQSVEGVLYNGDKSIILRYPEGKIGEKYSIPDGVITIGEQAFLNCQLLTEVIFSEEVETIGLGSFENCVNLETIEFSNILNDMGNIAFKGCKNLSEIKIPEGVSYIGYSNFAGCSSLKKINIPHSVTKIGAGAFDGCDSLKGLKIPKTIEEIGDKAYGYYWDSNSETYKLYDDVCIYGYGESVAEIYAVDNEIEFVNVYDITSEKKEVILEFFDNIFDNSISLIIEEFKDGQEKYESLNLKEKFEEISQEGKKYDFKVYDIKLLNEKGKEIQPNDSLWVNLLCPEGYDPYNCDVYHIDKDGNVSNMNATYDGEYFVFETDHFSVYFITEAKLKETPLYIVGDANGDEKVDSQDAVLLKKYLAGYEDLGINEIACDVNKDGSVNSLDAVILLKHLAGYEGILQ